MKTLQTLKMALVIATGIGMLAAAPAEAANLMGASVDANKKEILTVVDEHDAIVVLGTARNGFQTDENARRAGRLLVVNGYGRVSTMRSDYSDRNRVRIEKPRDGWDKIVILNKQSEIVGGVGLSQSEIEDITFAHDVSDAEDMLGLLSTSAQDSVFRAMQYAESNLSRRSNVTEQTRRSVASSYINMMSRNHSTDDLADAIGRSQARSDVAMAAGVSAMFGHHAGVTVADWVSTDNGGFGGGSGYVSTDNGGFGGGSGYVSTDNGGFGGGSGYVSTDNGGFGGGSGYVATDNGGFGGGSGRVAQWQDEELSLSVPGLQNISAQTRGTFLLISHYF